MNEVRKESYLEYLPFQIRKDIKTIYGILRALEIMGEAAKHVSHSIKKRYPEIPWKEMAGTRDKLIHHYLGLSQRGKKLSPPVQG